MLETMDIDGFKEDHIRELFTDVVIKYHQVVQPAGQALSEPPLKLCELMKLLYTVSFRQIALKKKTWNYFEAELQQRDPDDPPDRIAFAIYAADVWRCMQTDAGNDWDRLMDRYKQYVMILESSPSDEHQVVRKGMKLIEKPV